MSRRRWWEHGEYSLEDEAQWFEEDGLEFALDQELFRESEVVVFRGELRLGERRCPAAVIYPPSYAADGHPTVVAPDLPIGRHRSPSGHLCLDHPVFGRTQPMCGAEAVARAERLWDLWENDREKPREEEANAPDPNANYYEYMPESGITLVDADIGDGQRGYFDLAADQFNPLRGAVTRVRMTHPVPAKVESPPAITALAGRIELTGAWKRVDTAPPYALADIAPWLFEHHGAFVKRQARYACDQAKIHGSETPALIAFIYPDEGPARGATHDAWLFMALYPATGQLYLVRAFHLRSDERWLRQPQLSLLEEKQVMLIGAGALGSQIAGLLARAGVGRLLLVDYDIVTHGNRVRHELDLTDVGRSKVLALAKRVMAINPWIQVTTNTYRAGGSVLGAGENTTQKLDDELFDEACSSDLIINASADGVAGKYISSVGIDAGIPVLHGWVSAGAWGGRILVQRPRVSGCWNCLALAQQQGDRYQDDVVVPSVASDPSMTEVSERGCADPSFTGPGFELAAAAAAIARVAVQLLLEGSGGYPAVDFDLATLQFRDENHATPTAEYTRLPVHPDCVFCNTDP